MTAGRLIVWRHGRTEWNLDGRMQGQADVPLDAVGVAQAADAAARLASLNPARIVSSDLSRAAVTAAALSSLTGVEVEYDEALREIDIGEWAGLTSEEVAAKFPDFAEVIARGELGKHDLRRGTTGENLSEVSLRFASALTRIAAGSSSSSSADDTVVVVAHGLAARVGICGWLGVPFEHWAIFGGMSNCAWTSIRRGRNDLWRIEEWNAGTLPEPVLSDDPNK